MPGSSSRGEPDHPERAVLDLTSPVDRRIVNLPRAEAPDVDSPSGVDQAGPARRNDSHVDFDAVPFALGRI